MYISPKKNIVNTTKLTSKISNCEIQNILHKLQNQLSMKLEIEYQKVVDII